MTVVEWSQVLVSVLLQATIVVVATWLLERWSASSSQKSRLWTACFVSVLGLCVAAALLPRLQLVHPWNNLAPEQLLAVAGAEFLAGRIALALWSLGIAVMLVRRCWNWARIIHFIRRCPPLADKNLRILLSLLGNPPTINGRAVEFRICPEENGPFCYQLHKPMVFLPTSLFKGERADLKNVVLHELTHLETEHPVQLFLQRIVETIFWFHPLVWVSTKRAALVREFVCDDSVTSSGIATANYLKTLLRIVESRPNSGAGTLAIGRSASELRQRARRIAATLAPQQSACSRCAIMAVVVTALFVSQLWLPTNPLADGTSGYGPWPVWTASALHAFNITVRDFEPKHDRQLNELLEAAGQRGDDD